MIDCRQDDLVIHDGQLMSWPQALELMLAEFTPYGYTTTTIKKFVKRALEATQEYLYQLDCFSPQVRQASLERALQKDAEIAAAWRASAPGVREAHARQLQEEEEGYWQATAKAKWQAQFECWQRQNETGGRRAYSEVRARQRKKEDEATYRRILKKAEEPEWKPWYEPLRRRGETFHAMLACLSDHEYIEWMFACAKHGQMAPV